MLSSLSKFDKITAAGILARTALSLDEDDSPDSMYKVPDENRIRCQILVEIRSSLGLEANDFSVQAIEKVTDALEEEASGLIGQTNENEVLLQLSQRGRLPSDLYLITFDASLKNIYGAKFDSEQKLIESTIHNPDREEHLGAEDPDGVALVSLFSKFFPNIYPYKSFTLLTVGMRNGFNVLIQQAWRVYEDKVSSKGSETLINLLEKFADTYGCEIEINSSGKKVTFLRSLPVPEGKTIKDILHVRVRHDDLTLDEKKRSEAVIMHCDKRNFVGESISSLIYAVDVNKYRKSLVQHGW